MKTCIASEHVEGKSRNPSSAFICLLEIHRFWMSDFIVFQLYIDAFSLFTVVILYLKQLYLSHCCISLSWMFHKFIDDSSPPPSKNLLPKSELEHSLPKFRFGHGDTAVLLPGFAVN